MQQAPLFLSSAQYLETSLVYPIFEHLCNTIAIARHPHLHFDMVRLGAGLFDGHCLPALLLTSVISQVRRVKSNEMIGYNRRGLATRASRIGVIYIGYTDRLRHHIGNGQASVWVRSYRVPIIRGSVCIDMITIDLTNVRIENDTELKKYMHSRPKMLA